MLDSDDIWLVPLPRQNPKINAFFGDESTDFDAAAFIRVTQLATEVVHGADGYIRATQLSAEVVHGGTAYIHASQLVPEVVHGGTAFVHLSQLVIEVVRTIPKNIYVTQLVIEVVVKRQAACSCVASPDVSVCMHGNSLTYSNCTSGTATVFNDQLVGIPIPCA